MKTEPMKTWHMISIMLVFTAIGTVIPLFSHKFLGWPISSSGTDTGCISGLVIGGIIGILVALKICNRFHGGMTTSAARTLKQMAENERKSGLL